MTAEQQLLRSIDDLMASYKLSDIEELVIEDMKLEEISDAIREKLEQLTFLESLSINRCSLRKLNNLPKFEQLLRIQLDHNQIDGSQLNYLNEYKKVISISLMDNIIEKVEDLKPLGLLPTLLQLNLFKNPLQNQISYRVKAFELMPKMILLDNLYYDGSEVLLDDEIRIQEQRSKVYNGVERKSESKRRQTRQRMIADDGDSAQDNKQDSSFNQQDQRRNARKKIRR